MDVSWSGFGCARLNRVDPFYALSPPSSLHHPSSKNLCGNADLTEKGRASNLRMVLKCRPYLGPGIVQEHVKVLRESETFHI